MTVKELKELLNTMKDDQEVIANVNGRYFTITEVESNFSTNEAIIKLVKE
jgi:hypothetical protein